MRPSFLGTVVGLLFAALLFAASAPFAAAQEEEEEDAKPASREPKCTCATKNACWHYLHAPFDPPDGACWCEKCDGDHRHDGQTVPPGWNPQCFQSKATACFLRRHAASWKITCSECLSDDKCCNFKNHERCPACAEGEGKDPAKLDCFGKDARAAVAERVAVEAKVFGKRKFAVAYSRRFYVVCDFEQVRMRTQSGGGRYVDAHEYAHVALERAERVFRDFETAFRGRVTLLRPMGIYLVKRDTTAATLREAYFRNKNAPMIYSSYAGMAESKISEGFCLNGLCISESQCSDETGLYQSMRHLEANILVTCWIVRNGENKTMPRWAFEGAAHWVGRGENSTKDMCWFCIGEDRKVSGSGKMWMPDVEDMAVKGKLGPIDDLFRKSDLGQLSLDDHKRSWAMFEICMAEWRDPFVNMLADLRREVDVNEAFEKNLGCSPNEFQQRFIERLQGHRVPISAQKKDKVDVAALKLVILPGDSEGEIVGKIRALGVVTDPAVVKQVVDCLATSQSELVRATAMDALRKVKDEKARRAIWEHGLAHAERQARTLCARLCRNLRLAEAKDALRKLLDDAWWQARCEAMLALATLKDFDSQGKMREMAEGPSAKARIAAMDALAMFETEVNSACVPILAKNLNHPNWQVRVAACQDLKKIGDYEAVDGLVARLQIEAGRVSEEILLALRWITNEDLGPKPQNWKTWWEREGARVKERKGFDPKPSAKEKANERYARPEAPKYYGVELFSNRVGFVLDTSRSTNRLFDPDESTQLLLHKKYEKATIFEIAAEEVACSVEALDPRSYVNVIAFGSEVRKWERSMVLATDSAKKSARNFVHSYAAAGETNFHGSMSAALDLDDESLASPDLRDTLDTMVFLTDGTPTKGALTDSDMLIEWYYELNRYFRVRTHMYAFGRLEVDVDMLTKIADQSGGKFTQLFEEN
jgi:HEAT repeat protein